MGGWSDWLEPPTSPGAGMVEATGTFYSCAKCGTILPENVKISFCTYCGAKITNCVATMDLKNARSERRRSSIPFNNPTFLLGLAEEESPQRPVLIQTDLKRNHRVSNTYEDITDEDREIKLGARVYVKNRGYGIVKYVGVVHTKNKWKIGVELDKPKGKNDGSLSSSNGGEIIRYFNSPQKHGVFVLPSKVTVIPQGDEKLHIPESKLHFSELKYDHSRRRPSVAEAAATLLKSTARKLNFSKTPQKVVSYRIANLLLFTGIAVGITGSVLPRLWSFKDTDEFKNTLNIGIWTKSLCSLNGDCDVNDSTGSFGYIGRESEDVVDLGLCPGTVPSRVVWTLLRSLAIFAVLFNVVSVVQLHRPHVDPHTRFSSGAFSSLACFCYIGIVSIVVYMTRSCDIAQTNLGPSLMFFVIDVVLNFGGCILCYRKNILLRRQESKAFNDFDAV